MGVDTSRWSHLSDLVRRSIGALACFFLKSCSPNNYSVTICTYMYCQYNESVLSRKEQLVIIINAIQNFVYTLFTFTFAKRRIASPRTHSREF